jgi:hypothetical protein
LLKFTNFERQAAASTIATQQLHQARPPPPPPERKESAASTDVETTPVGRKRTKAAGCTAAEIGSDWRRRELAGSTPAGVAAH